MEPSIDSCGAPHFISNIFVAFLLKYIPCSVLLKRFSDHFWGDIYDANFEGNGEGAGER